jgi:hypothetical protein
MEKDEMTIKERIVTLLSMSGRTMTLGDIKGAMREMFAMTFTTEESQALRSLLDRQCGGVVAEGLGYRLATRP